VTSTDTGRRGGEWPRLISPFVDERTQPAAQQKLGQVSWRQKKLPLKTAKARNPTLAPSLTSLRNEPGEDVLVWGVSSYGQTGLPDYARGGGGGGCSSLTRKENIERNRF